MTRTITVRTPEVKPTRRTERKPSRFGAGLLATRPTYRVPATAADVAWHTLSLTTLEDAEYDRLADEAAFQDRYDRGLCF